MPIIWSKPCHKCNSQVGGGGGSPSNDPKSEPNLFFNTKEYEIISIQSYELRAVYTSVTLNLEETELLTSSFASTSLAHSPCCIPFYLKEQSEFASTSFENLLTLYYSRNMMTNALPLAISSSSLFLLDAAPFLAATERLCKGVSNVYEDATCSGKSSIFASTLKKIWLPCSKHF